MFISKDFIKKFHLTKSIPAIHLDSMIFRKALLVAVVAAICTFGAITLVRAAVAITATQTYAFIGGDGDGKADPGETIEYTVNVTNNGSTDAAGLQFDDDPDPNTTFVPGSLSASPVAVDDAYTAIGNVSISMSAGLGLLANDYFGLNPAATITAYDAASANGGAVVVNPDGSFSYDPPVGFTGTDTFTYTLDNPTGSSTGTVSVAVGGMLWFINDNGGACSSNCNGRLSHPFTTLAAFNGVNDGASGHPADNDTIFVYESAAPYTGGVTLRSGQMLIGQDATASLEVITGLTPPAGSAAFPAMNPGGDATTVQNSGGNAVTLNQNNTIRGLTISGTSGAGIIGTGINALTVGSDVSLSGVTGNDLDLSGAASGAVTFGASIANSIGRAVSIQNRTGGSVSLTGAIVDSGGAGVFLNNNTGATFTFSGGLVLSTGANPAFTATGGGTLNVCDENPCNPAATGSILNTLATSTGTALNVANTTIGMNNLEFRSISAGTGASGPAKGIVLNSTGSSGGLNVTGTGATDGSGGAIQSISTRGAEFTNTSNLSLKNMNFTAANNSVDAGGAGVCDDLTTTACNAAIYLSGVSTVTLDNLNVTGTMVEEGINGNTVSNFTLSNSAISNCGNEVEEGCIKMRGLTGTSTISNSDISFPGADAVEIVNTSGSLLLNVNNSTFRDSQASASGNTGIQLRNQGTASGIINVNGSTFLRIRTVGLNVQAINAGSADVDVTNSTFDPGTGTMIGMDLDADNTATLKFNIQNNAKVYGKNGPAINIFGDTNAVIDGRINNNNDVKVISNAPFSNVGSGIRVNLNKDSNGRIEIRNNNINVASDDAGIDVSGIGKTVANPGQTNTLDATITGNNVTIGATSTYGILVIAASNAGNTNAVCANVANNIVTRSPSSIFSFRARVASANGFLKLQGFVTNAEDTWNINSNTPTSSGGSEVSYGGSGTFAACTAALPTNPALTPVSLLPGSNHVVDQRQPETALVVLANTSTGSAPRPGLKQNFGAAGSGSAQAARPPAWVNKPPSEGTLVYNSGGGSRLIEPLPASALSGGIVSLNVGALPAGKSVTIKYRVTVNGPSLPLSMTQLSNQGTVSYDPAQTTLTDDPAIGGTSDPTITSVDRPDTSVISISRAASTPTNAGSVSWTVTFADPIGALSVSNFALVNTGLGGAPSIMGVVPVGGEPAAQWTVAAGTGAGDGTLGLNLANDAGASHDVTNAPFTGQVYTVDHTPPAVTLNQAVGQADPASSAPINFTAVFSEPVTGFATGDVTLSGTAGAATGVVTEVAPNDGTTYNVAVSGMTRDGLVSASIPAGVAQDAAANPNTASTGADSTVFFDTQPPDVTINQAAGQADPTSSSPINFTVVFSEPVTGFATGDVTLTGSAGATTGTVTEIAPNDGTTYNVAVSGMAGDGTVTASLAAGVAADLASKPNNPSTSTDNTVTYDATAPDTTITSNPSNPSSSRSASFTFSGNDGSGSGVSGFECDLDGGGFNPCTSPQNYSSLSDGSHTFQVRAFDNVGKVDPSPAAFTWLVDATAPDTTINSNPANPANNSSASFTFSGNDGSGSGVAGFECDLDSGGFSACFSPQSYSGLSDASHTFQVRAIDNVGNKDATPASFTWTVDTTSPSVVVSSLTTSPTNTSTILVTITFSEPVGGFTPVVAAGDIVVTNGSDSNPVAVDGRTYTFDLTPSGQGPVTVVVPSGSAFDAAANPNTVSNLFSITYDTVSPTVTIDQAAGQADPTKISPVNFTVVFSEPVAGFATGDVTLAGTAAATTAAVTEVAPNDGTTYNVAVSGMTTGGTIVATVNAFVAQDAAFNGNTASTSTDNTVTFTLDTTSSLTVEFGLSIFGTPVTLNAVVAVTPPGTGAPTGVVSFYDGASLLGTGTLAANGIATLVVPSIPYGQHSFTVIYSGDSNFAASQQTSLVLIPWRIDMPLIFK